MKAAIAVTLTSILFFSACACTTQEQVDAQMTVLPQSTPTMYNYRCESGQTIIATYPSSDLATVQYKGTSYKMQIAVSGSGARYVGGGLEWWTKGVGVGAMGTLFRHQTDGTSGEVIESCEEY